MSTEISDASNNPIDPEKAIAHAEGTKQKIWESLRNVEDPELPISVVDLGLIYDLTVSNSRAEISLTLTYSGCPAKDIITGDIKRAVYGIDEIDEVDITIIYSPPWDYDRITERGRHKLKEWGIAVPGNTESPDPACHN